MQPYDVREAQNPVYMCWSVLMIKNNVNRPRNRRELLMRPPSESGKNESGYWMEEKNYIIWPGSARSAERAPAS